MRKPSSGMRKPSENFPFGFERNEKGYDYTDFKEQSFTCCSDRSDSTLQKTNDP